MKKKLISIVTQTYNEEDNVRDMYNYIKLIIGDLNKYNYEHIFIDNSSTDNTINILREIANKDKNVKVIINSRNFGHINSPHFAILESKGDAVINLACDFQEPPKLIPTFLEEWEKGFKIVVGVKERIKKKFSFNFNIRDRYYDFVNKISNVSLIKNYSGFGLYDKEIIKILRKINDPNPYFRGLISEIGFDIKKIYYKHKPRDKGKTKNNLYTLYDLAMLGIINHSKIPLRITTLIGFVFSIINILIGSIYLIYKLIFWNSFDLGIAPLVIGMFLSFSIILFFLGIIGEYIGAMYTQILNRPLVIVKERINF